MPLTRNAVTLRACHAARIAAHHHGDLGWGRTGRLVVGVVHGPISPRRDRGLARSSRAPGAHRVRRRGTPRSPGSARCSTPASSTTPTRATPTTAWTVLTVDEGASATPSTGVTTARPATRDAAAAARDPRRAGGDERRASPSALYSTPSRGGRSPRRRAASTTHDGRCPRGAAPHDAATRRRPARGRHTPRPRRRASGRPPRGAPAGRAAWRGGAGRSRAERGWPMPPGTARRRPGPVTLADLPRRWGRRPPTSSGFTRRFGLPPHAYVVALAPRRPAGCCWRAVRPPRWPRLSGSTTRRTSPATSGATSAPPPAASAGPATGRPMTAGPHGRARALGTGAGGRHARAASMAARAMSTTSPGASGPPAAGGRSRARRPGR